MGGVAGPPSAATNSMHKALIGQEASLRLPCTVDVTALLVSFIDELMEVSGSETDNPERLEEDLKAIIDEVCAHDASCDLVVTLTIQDDGVEMHMVCEVGEAPAAGSEARIITVREG